MSIINDALKKAEKGVDEVKTDAERFVLRRWFIWTGTGVICLLGIILTAQSLRLPTDNVPVQRSILQRKVSANLLDLDFHLSGILYDQQRPLAIINNRIVGEGALINGAKLLEIQPNYVRLSLEEKELTLRMK